MTRKYNKSGKYSKYPQESVQSISAPVEERIKDNLRVTTPQVIETPPIKFVKSDKSFSFENLPQDTRKGVERILTYRRNLGIFDDSVERKERVVRYFKGRA